MVDQRPKRLTHHAAGTRPLSVAHVALLLPWITAIVAARLAIRDNSFLWHVAAGRLQIEQSVVISTDPFSFTYAGDPWRTQSWLVELLYGFFDNRSGLEFVTPFLALAAVVTFVMVLVATYRRTRSLEGTVIVGVMTAWLSSVYISPRPVLLSYLFLALVVAAHGERKLRWALVPIIWVWAAVHGSFILGIGYVVLNGLRHRDRATVADVGAMTLAATLTAHGFGVWQILLEFLRGTESLDLITEWRTPELTSLALVPFLGGLVLLIVAGIRARLDMAALWIVIPFLIFGASAARSVFPAWIALAPLVGNAFVGMRQASPTTGRGRWPLVVAVIALVVFPFVLPVEGGLSESFPLQAVDALTAERVFHDDIVGGYLIYEYGTQRRVFVDDRAELYDAEHFRDVIATRNATPVWRGVFDRWGIGQALLRSDDQLVQALRDDGWATDFEDEKYVVLSSTG